MMWGWSSFVEIFDKFIIFLSRFKKLQILISSTGICTHKYNATNICICHDPKWRCKFHHVVNTLRDTKKGDESVLPCQYADKVVNRVCTCVNRKHPKYKDDVWSGISKKLLLQAESRFWQYMANCDPQTIIDLQTFVAQVKKLFPQCLCYKHVCDSNLLRLFYVFQQISERNFSVIDRKTFQNEKNSYSFIVQRLHPKHIGYLIGRRGCNVKLIAKKYHCMITFETPVHEDNPIKHVLGEIRVTISFGDRGTTRNQRFKQVEKDLNCMAAKRIAQLEQMKTMWLQFRDRLVPRNLKTKHAYASNILDCKDCNRRKRDNRIACHTKYNALQKIRLPTILELGSRCLFCLLLYTKSIGNHDCQYHPGYLVSDNGKIRWNCCDELNDYRTPKHRDHANTGCRNGLHKWRTHRFAKGDTDKFMINKRRGHQRPHTKMVDDLDCQDVRDIIAEEESISEAVFHVEPWPRATITLGNFMTMPMSSTDFKDKRTF